MLEKFENAAFALKTHQMFPVHITLEELKTATISGHFGMCLRKTRAGRLHDYRDAIVFEKLRFQNVLRPRDNEKPAFSNSSVWKSVFEKVLFSTVIVERGPNRVDAAQEYFSRNDNCSKRNIC